MDDIRTAVRSLLECRGDDRDAWECIYVYVLSRTRHHAGCRCADDTVCEHRIRDVAQDVLAKLFRRLDQIRDVEAAAGFIDTVCQTTVAGEYRFRNRQCRGGDFVHLPFVDPGGAVHETDRALALEIENTHHTLPSEVAIRSDLDALVEAGLLSELEMKVFLEYLDARSVAEVATILGLPKTTVHRKLEDARVILRRAL